MKKRILVVDNDLSTYDHIQNAMRYEYIDICHALSEDEAAALVSQDEFHIIILGISLPIERTQEFILHIRKIKMIPILALSEKMSASNRIALFRAGVTAFQEKPLDTDICAAQILALIRLYMETGNQEQQALTFGTELIIDKTYHQVIVDGESLALTYKEFELLLCLAEHPCRIWSQAQLYSHVWNDDLGISDNRTVKTHIGNLKKKLAALGKNYIQNSRGVGYKFVPPLDST